MVAKKGYVEMSAVRGLDAKLYLNGTLIGLLTSIEMSWERAHLPVAPLGSLRHTDVLKGRRRYEGAFQKAYIDNTYINFFFDNTELAARLTPRPNICFNGTLVVTSGNLQSMATESTAALIEEGTFIMYNVSLGEGGECGSFCGYSFDGTSFDICL